MKNKTKILIVYFMTLCGIVFWIGALFMAPFLKSRSVSLNAFVYAVFSPICHQVSSRCFTIFGFPLAVCARCLGIYIGFLFGLFLYPGVRGFSNVSLPMAKTFVLITLPLVIDVAGNVLSLWMTPSEIRFVIGFIWGNILPFYFVTGFSELLRINNNKKNNSI